MIIPLREVLIFGLCLLCSFFHALEAAEIPTQNTSPPAYAVDFNHPPRAYITTHHGPWELWLEKELSQHHPLLASNATKRLLFNLDLVLQKFPPHSHKLLTQRKIFLMLGEKSSLGGKNNGGDYFQKNAPEYFPQLDPRMASSILIYSATNYVWLSDLWALKLLTHEFAHAWHLEQWPEEQATILGAYRNAMDLGLYRNVNRNDGKTLPAAYATANQLEYFAELSSMYFAACDYAPINQVQLRDYDPFGFQMIADMWGIPPSASP